MEDTTKNPSSQELLKQLKNRPPQAGKKLNWKGFGIGIIIVIIIEIVAFNALKSDNQQKPVASSHVKPTVSQPAKNTTANGKTYTNTKYGFSLMIPSKMQTAFKLDVNPSTKSGIQSVDMASFYEGKPAEIGGYTGPAFNIIIYPEKGNEMWVTESFPSSPNDKEFTIAGEKLKEIFVQSSIMIGPLKHNGYIFEFQTINPNDTEEQTNQLLTIFKTFKFTDQTNDTSNWKTYSTDVASLKYPNTWIIYTDSAYIYDPKSLTKVRMNSGATQLLPKEYLSMISYASTETAKQVVDESIKGNPAYNGVNLERKTITINGLQAEMYTELGEGSHGYDIVISNGKDLAFLTIPVSDPRSDPVINHILSTFKFTN